MIFYACDIPEDLTYDIERDVWIRFDGDFATLGMTDVAQTRCGKFAALSFRNVGKKVEQGKPLATIESAKWVGPFPAPFACEIVETNEAGFAKDILLANKDPYGIGWLVKVRPSNLEAESSHLVTGEAAAEKYKERIRELKVNCLRCID
ncbi:MAG: glycine cleavage system protein H [Anaerolineales bacterium]|nr:glycine cleavage system protein H [Anaerolineales bacterium]